MPYLLTIWEKDIHEEAEQFDSEVGDMEGELFSRLVDLEADLAEDHIKAFKVRKVEE